jgi:hypothetical protein
MPKPTNKPSGAPPNSGHDGQQTPKYTAPNTGGQQPTRAPAPSTKPVNK